MKKRHFTQSEVQEIPKGTDNDLQIPFYYPHLDPCPTDEYIELEEIRKNKRRSTNEMET